MYLRNWIRGGSKKRNKTIEKKKKEKKKQKKLKLNFKKDERCKNAIVASIYELLISKRGREQSHGGQSKASGKEEKCKLSRHSKKSNRV